MLKMIINYKNLFVADFSNQEEKIVKIIFSKYPNYSLGGQIIYPFAEEVETGESILISNRQHVKSLSHYVNWFGFPKKKILDYEKEKQKLVMEEVKVLKKLRKI